MISDRNFVLFFIPLNLFRLPPPKYPTTCQAPCILPPSVTCCCDCLLHHFSAPRCPTIFFHNEGSPFQKQSTVPSIASTPSSLSLSPLSMELITNHLLLCCCCLFLFFLFNFKLYNLIQNTLNKLKYLNTP